MGKTIIIRAMQSDTAEKAAAIIAEQQKSENVVESKIVSRQTDKGEIYVSTTVVKKEEL